MVGYGRERESERGSCRIQRYGSEKVKAVMNRLMQEACLLPTDMAFFRFWATAKGHVWIHGSATAMVYIDVNGPCYHQVPWGCLGSGLPPVSTYEPKGTIVIWMPWAAAPSHGMIQAWALARVHVWIHDPTIARVYVDVHGTCYHWGFCGCTGSGLPLGIDWGPRAIL